MCILLWRIYALAHLGTDPFLTICVSFWQTLLHPDAHEEGGLAMNNRALLEQQRGAIFELIGTLSKQLLTGHVNLVNVSMPVKMFEPRSYLEKLSDVWVHARMLNIAAQAEDPVHRLKWVVTWCGGCFLSAILCSVTLPLPVRIVTTLPALNAGCCAGLWLAYSMCFSLGESPSILFSERHGRPLWAMAQLFSLNRSAITLLSQHSKCLDQVSGVSA